DINAIGPLAAEAAVAELNRLKPQPWPADWQQAKNALDKIDRPTVSDAVWITSGLGNVDAKIFYNALQSGGGLKVIGTAVPIYLVTPPQTEDGQTSLAVLRAETEFAATATLDAVSIDGNVLARLPVNFSAGAPRAIVPLDLPLDIRNSIARFEIE